MSNETSTISHDYYDYFDEEDAFAIYSSPHESEAWKRFLVVALTTIIGLGSMTNGLCMAVFGRREMRAVPAYVGLFLLAAADTAVLVWGFGHMWLRMATGVSLTARSISYCAFAHVLFGALVDLTTLLVLGIAASCACRCAGAAKCFVTCCGPKVRALAWTAVALVACCMANSYHIWCVEMLMVSSEHAFCYDSCESNVSGLRLARYLGTDVLVVCMTLTLACQVYHCGSRQQFSPRRDDSDSNNVDVGSRLHVTVIGLCVLFLVTHVPFSIEIFVHIENYVVSYIMYDLISLLHCTYFSAKIFIYVFLAPDFRRHLTHLMTSVCRLRRISTSSSNIFLVGEAEILTTTID